MTTFPTLYKKGALNKILEWDIAVDGNVIIVTHGKRGGKKQTEKETIKEGKNIGKANETSPEDQAKLEATAKFIKQKKKNYHENLEDAESGAVSETILGGVPPMLAPNQPYPKHGHKIKFPCFVQPKLDGHRMIAILKNGKCTLWSRTRKPINSLPHIAREIEEVFGQFQDRIFDGEAYNHEYAKEYGFEGLSSLIRQSKPQPGCENIQYHIYDIVNDDKTFRARNDELQWLNNYLKSKNIAPKYIHFVSTSIVNNDKEIFLFHDRCVELGYEGAMVRNDALYQQDKRSFNLQKVKMFVEEEFPIIGYTEGTGKDAGTIGSFTCLTKGQKEFACRLKATYDRRRELFKNPKEFEDMNLTIRYQNMSKDGIPRFPIGKGLRNKSGD